MLAVKVSDEESPLLSVAVTVMPRFSAVDGAVPVNAPVAALNVSQDGSTCPLDWVAA
jgi:hypothetical protein